VRTAHAAHLAEAPEKDILAHAHGIDQVKLLIDDAQSPVEGFYRRRLLNGLPVKYNRSGVLFVYTGENLHQRRFPRAVFPNDSMHDSARNLDGDAVQRFNAGKRFAHVLDGKDDSQILLFHSATTPFE
jgi:hypothetical protein